MSHRSILSLARRRLTRQRIRRGFTLVEILIVIVMISLLALVVVPRFSAGNGRRHMESARMRIAAGLATARQAAIQKGETVRFQISANRVTVRRKAGTTDLMSPVPLDTLYKVRVTNSAELGDPFTVDFSSRGFASRTSAATIRLSRTGVADDSVTITKTGMVTR